MFLQITARPDAQQIAAAVRHHRRGHLVQARLLGWALIAAAMLVGNPVNYPLLLAGAAVALGLPLLWVGLAVRRASAEPETTYEVTEAGVANSSVHSRHAYSWGSLTRVTKLPGQLVFGLGGRRFLPMPTAGLTTWQVEEVLTLAAGAGLPVRRPL
nr:YcxB family protein [uncultured Actinoplanes sp.]